MINWTEIILALIGLMGAILTSVLVPYIRTKYSQDQLDKARMWLEVFCSAAETAFDNGSIRKEWVLDQMQRVGIKLTAVELDACLEAVVRELTAAGVINC